MITVYHLEKLPILREAFTKACELEGDIKSAGSSDDPKACLESSRLTGVEVIVVDLELVEDNQQASKHSISFCETVRERNPGIDVIIHSSYRQVAGIDRLVRAGARGLVSKDSGFDVLVSAIRAVKKGEYYFCQQTAKQIDNLLMFLKNPSLAIKSRFSIFSKREEEVLALLAAGYSSIEIGNELCISLKTVETHRKHLTEKARVKNTAELIGYAASCGLLRR